MRPTDRLQTLAVCALTVSLLFPCALTARELAPEGLQNLTRAMESAVEQGRLAGAVSLVLKDGKVVYTQAVGHADLDDGMEMRSDTIFRIASMTKAITSAAVLILVDEEKIKLTDPVSKYIPEFASPRVLTLGDDGTITGTRPARGEITIEHLLTHSSGISYPFQDTPLKSLYDEAGIIDGVTSDPLTLGEVMRTLGALPLLADPGERFIYGLSTDLLGYLIEVVTGQALDRFLNERIFEPLNMADTAFYLPDEKAPRLATLYSWDQESAVLSEARMDENLNIPVNPRFPVEGARSYFSGGAGLSSTAGDYARFCQAILNRGELDGVRILKPETVQLLYVPRFDWDNDGLADFSLGFGVLNAKSAVEASAPEGVLRWGGAFNTDYFIDPEERMIGIFMSQAMPSQGDMRSSFIKLVYAALE